jgi:hypothetical protein
MEFIVRAALADESNDGWVWISESATNGIYSRDIVKIKRPGFCAVYAVARIIDKNFREDYDDDPRKRRYQILKDEHTIVMSGWYRDALGGLKTTDCDNITGKAQLEIMRARFWIWRSLRAACSHPDPNVRLGTRLGVLGTWLGFFGALLGVSSSNAFSCNPVLEIWLWIVLFVLAVLSVISCWDAPKPSRGKK